MSDYPVALAIHETVSFDAQQLHIESSRHLHEK